MTPRQMFDSEDGEQMAAEQAKCRRYLSEWQGLMRGQRMSDTPLGGALAKAAMGAMAKSGQLEQAAAFHSERERTIERLMKTYGKCVNSVPGADPQDLFFLFNMGVISDPLQGSDGDGPIAATTDGTERRAEMATTGQKWLSSRNTYAHSGSMGPGAPVFPPGMPAMVMRDSLTGDAEAEKYFAAYENWYPSSYGCRTCPSPMFKTVFPTGREVEIATNDHANPAIAIKRLFTCARCQRFVTTAVPEDDLGVAGGGYLSEPNNFEYLCGSTAEYQELLEATNAKGTTVGRQDAGFIRLIKLPMPTPAPAFDAPPQDEAVVDRAQTRYAMGNAVYLKGDRTSARGWFQQAADGGHSGAMRNLGILAAQDGDEAAALIWFRRAAGHGDTVAMYRLGSVAYSNGDRTAARSWYRRAADLGHPAAMNGLGWLFDEDGDHASALTWYRRAAEGGDGAAMFVLGTLAAYPDGDWVTSRDWMQRAADHGEAQAMCALGVLAEKQGDLTSARAWFWRAADQGDIEAMRTLGMLDLKDGDRGTFTAWMQRAADHGDTEAKATLAAAAVEDARRASARETTTPKSSPVVRDDARAAREVAKSTTPGGCYVATAVYGSYDCPEVWVLRRWRDSRLASTTAGRQVIRLYYGISPAVVRSVGNQAWFTAVVRRPLDHFVGHLEESGYSSLPYSDR